MGFDWHSSGVTTTVCGALKEGLKDIGPEAGLFFAGGKGRVSRNTPLEIQTLADKAAISGADNLIMASRLSAKVDSAAVQDGFDIYHHFFVFTRQGEWAVIQQGMNENIRQARRYHWFSPDMHSFTNEPHNAVCCDAVGSALNLVAEDNSLVRRSCVRLSQTNPEKLLKDVDEVQSCVNTLSMPGYHSIPRTGYLKKALTAAYENQAQNFETLLQTPGVGAGTLRALCLVAEVAWGVPASFKDPVRYSFAHGGKDGFPFPVNESDIMNSSRTLERALHKARTGRSEQLEALRRLARWHSEAVQVKVSPDVKSETLSTSLNSSTRIRQMNLFD